MANRIILLFCAVVYISITGCTTLNRYRSVTYPGKNNSLADIDLFGVRLSQPEPAEARKSLWNLSADAQSQIIKILNGRFPDNDMFLSSLNFDFIKENEGSISEDYANRDLRLIFSVSKRRDYSGKGEYSGIKITPADRIEYLRITLKLKGDSIIRFTGWNMYSTEYATVDLADVSFSRSLEFDASKSITSKTDGTGSESSAGVKSSFSRTEDQKLKYRYLKLNGKISPGTIVMEEEGTREIDLTGNIIADVSLVFSTYPETLFKTSQLKDSLGEFSDPDVVLMDYYLISVPAMEEIRDTIYADMEMDYVYRNVIGGGKSYPEWDDHIKYYEGKVLKSIPLLTSPDYVPEFYCIGSVNKAKERDLLKVKSPSGRLFDLKFKTYAEAYAFSRWLLEFPGKDTNPDKTVKLQGQTLQFKNKDLRYGQTKDYDSFRVLTYYKY